MSREESQKLSLDEEAQKRKERLALLKKRKRPQNETGEEAELPSAPLEVRSLPREEDSIPTEPPVDENGEGILGEETVEEAAARIAAKAKAEAEKMKTDAPIDLFSLAGTKTRDYDLKRNLEQKLTRLKPRTDAAIATLLRQRLMEQQEKKNGGEADLAAGMEMREQEARAEAAMEDA
ncbi:hypothetical protein YB2330_002804 [Saitoella coloradoensis]